MSFLELRRSWKRTAAYLDEAYRLFPKHVTEKHAEVFEAYEEYILHNEYELALDMLEAALDRSEDACVESMKPMGLAAANMGLIDRQLRIERRLRAAQHPPTEVSPEQ